MKKTVKEKAINKIRDSRLRTSALNDRRREYLTYIEGLLIDDLLDPNVVLSTRLTTANLYRLYITSDRHLPKKGTEE